MVPTWWILLVLCLWWTSSAQTQRNQRNWGPYPGQGWPFREAVIRAQCRANCLSKYGIEPAVDPNWLKIYEVFVPLTCPQSDGPCTQCLNPCFFIFGTRDYCYSACTTRDCTMSCDKIHDLLAFEQKIHDVSYSQFVMRTGPPHLTCEHISYYDDGEMLDESGTGGTEIYLSWDVRSAGFSPPAIPMTFVVEVSAKHEGSFTNWVPFSETHAWIPVYANWSTPYYFRVTPVLKDGVAGRSRTSKLITTLPSAKWHDGGPKQTRHPCLDYLPHRGPFCISYLLQRYSTSGESLLTYYWICPEGRPDLQSPTGLRVLKQLVRDNQLYVTFEWNPPDILTCHYELILLPTGLSDVISSDAVSISHIPQPRYQYGPLPYDTEYTARLSACSASQRCTHETTAVTFITEKCLQANNYSFFLCDPEGVEGMEVVKLEEYPVAVNKTWIDCLVRLEIQWFPPPHASLSNPITDYKISLVKFPNYHQSAPFEPHELSVHVPSNTTKQTLVGLHQQSEYIIRLRALSYGGSSIPNTLYINTSVASSICHSSNVIIPPAKQEDDGEKSKLLNILAPTLCALVAIIFVVLAATCYRRYQYRRNASSRPRNKMAGNPLYESFKRGSSVSSKASIRNADDLYEIDYEDLVLDETLGQGAFGKVVKGRLNVLPRSLKGSKSRPPFTVAVKMLKDISGVADADCLQQEIALMKTLGRHPNVVSLVACVTIAPQVALVMDYCSHGDLKMYLRKLRAKYAPLLGCQTGYSGVTLLSGRRFPSIDSSLASAADPSVPTTHPAARASSLGAYTTVGGRSQRYSAYIDEKELLVNSTLDTADKDVDCGLSPIQLLSFARQIAVGMEYLSQKKFIHRDLAARNVLVCDDGLLKISDFGLTRDIYEHNVYHKQTDGKLPIKWMSIEAIFDQIYTTKSDVWSFGIVLWEITTLGGTPYPGISSGDVYHKLKEGYRMEKPDNCSDEFYAIMRSCWMTDPDERPDFTELRSTLERMIEEDQDNSYLSLELATDNTTDNDIEPDIRTDGSAVGAESDARTISEEKPPAKAPQKLVENRPKHFLGTVSPESEPLLSGTLIRDDMMSISEFPRRKRERVQNVYTDMKSQSKDSLPKFPSSHSVGYLTPIRTQHRSKSSQELDHSQGSQGALKLTLGLRFGKHASADNIDSDVNDPAARSHITKEMMDAESIKICLSETTHELLKFWMPERDEPKENDEMTDPWYFPRGHRNSTNVESRL